MYKNVVKTTYLGLHDQLAEVARIQRINYALHQSSYVQECNFQRKSA